MSVNDELGKRMKESYEVISKTKLMRRTPVAIRIDGKAFHTFTRHFEKPFDKIFSDSMIETMKYLCENIQGCVFGYTQSDEITLILIDYKNLNSSAWFDYEVQKICSISASMATMKFNQIFNQKTREESENIEKEFRENSRYFLSEEGNGGYRVTLSNAHCRSAENGAMFDARCFNIPKEEVTNLVYWRQLDAIRNSIQSTGQAYFSHKELHNKSQSDILEMLMQQRSINWSEDIPTKWRVGTACYKENFYDSEKNVTRQRWTIDREMPILKEDGRNYLNKFIYVGN